MRVEDADGVTRGLVLRLRVEEKGREGQGEEAEGSSHYKKVILLIEAGPALIMDLDNRLSYGLRQLLLAFIDKMR